MDRYQIKIDVSQARVADLRSILEKLREYGTASYLGADSLSVLATFEVGDGTINDLWDLREMFEELEAELSGWLGVCKLDKPEKV